MQFTISARGKASAVPIQRFIKDNYNHIPLEQIDRFFGFTEASTLYGGRIFSGTELSRYDVRSLDRMNINVRLPITNHYATPEEFEENQLFLEKYHPVCKRRMCLYLSVQDLLSHCIKGQQRR